MIVSEAQRVSGLQRALIIDKVFVYILVVVLVTALKTYSPIVWAESLTNKLLIKKVVFSVCCLPALYKCNALVKESILL